MDENTIGETAGRIWEYLRAHGGASLTSVEKAAKAPKNVTHMAVGWLAREGKLEFQEKDRTFHISLRDL